MSEGKIVLTLPVWCDEAAARIIVRDAVAALECLVPTAERPQVMVSDARIVWRPDLNEVRRATMATESERRREFRKLLSGAA